MPTYQEKSPAIAPSKPAGEPTPNGVTQSAAASGERSVDAPSDTNSAPARAPAPVAEVDWKAKKKELMLSALRSDPQADLQPTASEEAAPKRPPMLFSAGDLAGAKLKKAPVAGATAAASGQSNLMAEIMNAKRNKLKPASRKQATAPRKTEPPSMMDEIRLRMQARHARMKAEEEVDENAAEWE